jgi:hypothetical protein
VPFDAKNLENEHAKEKKKIKNRDIEELIILIKDAKINMPRFTHSFDIDSNNTVQSVF